MLAHKQHPLSLFFFIGRMPDSEEKRQLFRAAARRISKMRLFSNCPTPDSKDAAFTAPAQSPSPLPSFELAPTSLLNTSPFRKIIIVGIDITLYRTAISGFSSTFSFPIFTLPSYSPASCSRSPAPSSGTDRTSLHKNQPVPESPISVPPPQNSRS